MKPNPVRTFTSKAIELLFPGKCLHCQLPSGRNMELCSACEADLLPLLNCCEICAEPLPEQGICGQCLKSEPAFSQIRAPYLYEPPLSTWVNRFKHHGDLRSGKVLGQLLARHLYPELANPREPDCILPLPLHWRRRFSRGFNQAQEIARAVAGDTQIPLRPGLAKRIRHTPHQQGKTREERLANLRRAFQASPECKGLHIAVVDDVVTTASTAQSIATALRGAGACRVEIWAIARTSLVK